MKDALSKPCCVPFRNPFRILRVGFATRDRFHVLRIDEHDLEQPLHQIEDGLPIHPGRLEGYVGAASTLQPIDETE
jgi:hypothetical protein